jgi:hypothetical protein
MIKNSLDDFLTDEEDSDIDSADETPVRKVTSAGKYSEPPQESEIPQPKKRQHLKQENPEEVVALPTIEKKEEEERIELCMSDEDQSNKDHLNETVEERVNRVIEESA